MAASRKKTALTHATLMGGASGIEPREETTILVDDGRILAVGRSLAVPFGFNEIDLDGRYVLPGLINLHARLYESGFPSRKQRDPIKEARRLMSNRFGRMVAFNRCAAYARTELLSGVTSLRTPGGLGNIDYHLKEAVDGSSILGPRLLVSNMTISTSAEMAADKAACVAQDEEDCAQLVARMIAGNADTITLMIGGAVRNADERTRAATAAAKEQLLTRDGKIDKMTGAAVTVATAAGLSVAAECDSAEAAAIALKNGIPMIICRDNGEAAGVQDMRAKGAALVRPISPVIATICARRKETGEKNRQELDDYVAALKAAVEAGVAVGLGTDPGMPYVTHYDMWRELEYFRRFVGVSREETLRIATIGNATIAGISEETGSIEEGKSADLIVTNRNPLVDLEALRDLHLVMFRGGVIAQPKPMKNSASEEALDSIMRELW